MVDTAPPGATRAGRDRATPLAGPVEILDRTGDRVVAATGVPPDEPVLAGHFPNFPIFPGVCLLECAHQTVLGAAAGPAGPGEVPDLSVIERARFRQPVFPGDQVRAEAAVTPDRSGVRARVEVSAGPPGAEPVQAATFRLAYQARPVRPPGVDIKALLPHRFPMLLVDRVTEVVPQQSLQAIKAVTLNEPCYAAIADDADQAYPPALMVESWCQAAGILACLEHPDPAAFQGRVTLFASITDLELPGRAYPGDVLRHTVRLVRLVSDAAILEGGSTIEGRTVQTVGGITIALRPAGVLSRAGGTGAQP